MGTRKSIDGALHRQFRAIILFFIINYYIVLFYYFGLGM